MRRIVFGSITPASAVGNSPRRRRPSRTHFPRLFRWEWLMPICTLILIMLLAETLIRNLNIPEPVIPKPSVVLSTLISDFGTIWRNLRITIAEALTGFALGTFAAICTALLFTLVRPLKSGFLPLLVALQTVPVIVLAPILSMVMGNGMAPKIVVAGLICYFPTLVNMVRGLNSVDRGLLDLFTVLNASRLQTLFKLRLPASLRFLFSSIKIATANCFIGALVAEWISADRGAGYLMVIKMYQLETAELYATVVATSLTAILLFKLAEKAEIWFMPWTNPLDES